MSEISLLHEVVRLGDASSVHDRIAEIAAECEGQLITVYAKHAQSASADDAVGLAESARLFEELGAFLMAAEAAAEAAQAFSRAGDPRKAAFWTVRTRELAAQCEGARTPALALGSSVAPLTRREREIAALAASGLPSRDIAARLHLSVRTVDNHLQNVYTKLGIAGRNDLSAAPESGGTR